jgi:sec-independent protein translocase protein TatC
MEDKELTIVEHLGELRKRVIYVLVAVLITSGAAYHFIDEILAFITTAGKVENLVFINPTEAFFVIVKLSILVGIIGAMPFIQYHVWKYVGVALKKQERKYLIFFGPVSLILFLIGAGFAFRTVLPMAMRFLLSFARDNIESMITLNNYVSFLIKMVSAFGLMFELPLVVLFLSKIGIVTPEALKKGRKYAVVVIFLVAAVLTPPDVISQIMLAVPILLLYEISIWICKSVTRKREEQEKMGEPAVSEV